MGRSRVRAATGVLLVAGALASAPSAAPERAPRVVVLLSQNAPPYSDALAGVRRHLEARQPGAAIEVVDLRGDEATGIPAAGTEAPDAVISLGSVAARAAARRFPSAPLVAGLVLGPEDLRGAGNATGVALQFSAETELQWIRKALPGQTRVGVLFNVRENQGRVDQAGRAARALGLSLHALPLAAPSEIPAALETLGRRADVIWGLPDQIALTPATARPILLFAMRRRMPFVGLSRTWVEAGSLYALDRDYADIGAQCGELALKILRGARPSALPPESPRKVVYYVNLKTARHLKLDLPEEFLRGASGVIE